METITYLNKDIQKKHLINRATFACSKQEYDQYMSMELNDLVDILTLEKKDDSLVETIIVDSLKSDPRLKKTAALHDWLLRISKTNNPLIEKMNYFWHDHFAIHATGNSKALYAYTYMLRGKSLNQFDDLLVSVARSPAMLLSLDGARSTKIAPNENFAREVMELHTLGPGNYTEDDIKEAARIFTGWVVKGGSNKEQYKETPITTKFYKYRSDQSSKQVRGIKGNISDDEFLTSLANDPATHDALIRKIWKFFINTNPNEKDIKSIKQVFVKSNLSISITLNKLMKMPNFYETKNYRNKIKTPLECILGTIRKLEIPIENYRISNNLHYMMRNMGLDLYKPPGPNGWIKNTNEWLNYNTTIQRANAAGYLSGAALNGSGKDSHFMKLLEKYDVELQPEKIVNFYLELLTNTEVNIKIKKVLIEHLKNKKTQNGFDYSRINGLIYLILTMPEYQLI